MKDMLHVGTIDPSPAALLERARASMPGGVNSGQRQIPELEDLVITSTSGARFTDSYGRTYTDYHAAFGPPLFSITTSPIHSGVPRKFMPRQTSSRASGGARIRRKDMSETFKIGDVVRLKSGGPAMTVNKVGNIEDGEPAVWCVWLEGDKKTEEFFHPGTLERDQPAVATSVISDFNPYDGD